MKHHFLRSGSVLALLAVTACAYVPTPFEKPYHLDTKSVQYNTLHGWHGKAHEETMEAFVRGCVVFDKMPPNRSLGVAGIASKWQSLCNAARNLQQRVAGSYNAERTYGKFFEENFTPLLATNHGETEGTFTGYFEPELTGSKVKTKRFRYPVYRTPQKGRTSYSRKQIDNGALAGKGLELAYVDDPIALFFLQIQGSGRIRLPNGGIMRVGYAQQNGHKYFPIGRYLVDEGYYTKEQMNAPLIRKWLLEHPSQAMRVMQLNPSYVFFRELKGEDKGPIGAAGVPIVGGFTLAVDRKFIPLGIPIWLQTTYPNQAKTPLNRLMVALDTGGAIKGPVRGDVFFGAGKEAEWLAGHMKQKGRYYLLVPR